MDLRWAMLRVAAISGVIKATSATKVVSGMWVNGMERQPLTGQAAVAFY
jgi:hypothetical protein